MTTYNPSIPVALPATMADEHANSLAGRSLEEAVEVLTTSRDVDRDRARAVLEGVSAEGTVTRAALQDRLGHVAKVVATPESRVEFAAMDLAEARRVADPVADRAPVQSRIEEYEARLTALESRVEELQGTLQELVEAHEAADIYSVALDLYQLRTAANEVQRQADDLSKDLEGFQEWLDDDERRVAAFGEDLELVEAELDAVATDIDALGEADAQRGRRWLDATLRSRLFELLLADLQAEWEALRSWADQEEGSLADWDEFEAQLEALEARHEALSSDLEDATDPDWTERFGDRIEAFSAAVEPADPPIDWAAVQSAFETHRPNVEPLSIE